MEKLSCYKAEVFDTLLFAMSGMLKMQYFYYNSK